MKNLLQKRIDASDDKTASLQLLIGGQLFAGAVRCSDEGDDLFELLTVGQDQNGQPHMLKVTFSGDACEAIFEPHEEPPPSILMPKKRGLVVPGVS
jgi:hypothetical protein